MNNTIKKFGYPESLIHDYKHWLILLRPKQVTLGSLVLAYKGTESRAGDVPAEAYAELSNIKQDIESVLHQLFGMEKINYLMLMMVDKEVHYHVIPRYSHPVSFSDIRFEDAGWPALPRLDCCTPLSAKQHLALTELLQKNWP